MVKLVVNNKAKSKSKNPSLTCRNNCELFDEITGTCSIHHGIDPDNPLIALRCGEIIYKEVNSHQRVFNPSKMIKYTLIEEEADYTFDDQEVFLELMGDKFDPSKSRYPLSPDFPSRRDDAIWYVSPDQTFGCWIINKSKRRFVTVPKDNSVEFGWSKKVYKSPFPLHDHKASKSLASRMAWYVDEDGYGQYVILLNGKISMISAPKPRNWT
jgi:hypothetical protein